ncbi:MAG: ATP-binding protein [Bacteroidetes bacterium]|nr:ATP-binding protein [Bacteroidota bacterium]
MNILKELSINSDLKDINLVQQLIEDFCDEFNINNTYFGNISVTVNEAVKNAIIHGNELKAEKKVNIIVGKDHQAYIFIISDNGKGFDFINLPDPTDINNETFTGTGIYLIKSLADKVEFKNHGKTVEIYFFLININAALASERVSKLSTYHNAKIKKAAKLAK